MTAALLPAYFPHWSDLWELASILVVAAAFLGLGRLVAPKSGLVEIDVIAGWGLACTRLAKVCRKPTATLAQKSMTLGLPLS